MVLINFGKNDVKLFLSSVYNHEAIRILILSSWYNINQYVNLYFISSFVYFIYFYHLIILIILFCLFIFLFFYFLGGGDNNGY